MDSAKALQFYYTSCRNGLSGYAGFQTYAESMGLQPAERQELERKALYHPPRDLPHEPDADTIAALFPKAFRTFRLSSGRTALVHSVYTGQDYSGRWGNYFSHGLVLDRLSRNRWPIDGYSWRGWVKGIEDTGELKALPAVTVAELTTGIDFEFDELKTFLVEEEDKAREDVLAKMLDAVFSREVDSRNIVIRETIELDAVYWIACIQKAFPPEFQQELTCSTFQFDPRSAFAVNATLGETDFLFDNGEFNYQFYVFDFVADKHSKVSSECNEYTQTIAAWMKSDPEKLRKFHKFASIFSCHKIGTELISILRLYRLEQGESVFFSPVEFHEILGFIKKHAHPGETTRILGSFKGVRQGLKKAASIDERLLIIRSLEKLATLTNGGKDREELSAAWIEVFDDLVFRKRHNESTVLSLRAEIEKRSGKTGREIASAFLDDTHLDWMLANITTLPAKSLNIIAGQIDRSCYLLGRIPTYNCQEIKSLVECVLSHRVGLTEDFHWLFDVYKDDSDAIVSLIDQVFSVVEGLSVDKQSASNRLKTVSNNLGQLLSNILISNAHSSKSSSFRIEVLHRLVSDIRFLDVVLSEWQSSLPHTKSVSKAYDYYDDNILCSNTRSANVVRERIAGTLLKMLNDEEKQQQQAKDWVESSRWQKFSESFADNILDLASKGITLLPEDKYSEKISNKISLETHALNMATPNRIRLRELVKLTLGGIVSKERLWEQLSDFNEKNYSEYLGAVLPMMMSDSTTIDSHRDMLFSLNPNNKTLPFFKEKYISIIKQNYFNQMDESHIATIGFWVKLSEKDQCWLTFKDMKHDVEESLVAALGAARKNTRLKVIQYLQKSPEMIDCRKKLIDFEERLNESTASTSFFRKFF